MHTLRINSLHVLGVLGPLLLSQGCGKFSGPPSCPAGMTCRELGFGFAGRHHDAVVRQAVAAVRATPAELDGIVAALEDGPADDLRLDTLADAAGHLFPFDQSRVTWEVERAYLAFDDQRLADVFLRGLFMQFGYDHVSDPAACQAFLSSAPRMSERERAFGMANGMVWGLMADVPSGAPPEVETAEAIGRQLEGDLAVLFFEELGWQQNAYGSGGSLETRYQELGALTGGEHQCAVIHGYVRSATGGEASLDESLAWVQRSPPDCDLHVLHAAQRRRCLTPIHLDRDTGIAERCGFDPGRMAEWVSLDLLP